MGAPPLGPRSALYWALHSCMVKALTGVPNKQTTTTERRQRIAMQISCFEAYHQALRYRLPATRSGSAQIRRQSKNSTAPVSKLYIAPVILMPPLDSNSASTVLSFRMFATVARRSSAQQHPQRHNSSPFVRQNRTLLEQLV